MDIKVVLSLLAILSAAGIALFCDYRRGRDARMREAMVELKVRQVETEALVAKAPEGTPRPLSRVSRQYPVKPQPQAGGSPDVPSDAPAEISSGRRTRRRQPAPEPLIVEEVPEGRETEMASNKSLSEWLIQRAVARAAGKVEAENRTMENPPPDETSSEPQPPREPEKPSQAVRPESKVKVVVDEFLWESLLTPPAELDPKPQPKGKLAVVEMVTGARKEAIEISIPAGFHDSATLSKVLVESGKFSGLVVVIGVGQADSRLPQDPEIFAAVRGVLEGLLGQRDFGCRTGEDEFLIICPGESGMEAQRRLNFLSESLWDYQLQTLGTFSIFFSLGSVDVLDESLQDAILSARERMAETRRSRKPIPALAVGLGPELV